MLVREPAKGPTAEVTASSFLSCSAGVLAVVGERFPEEIRLLVMATTPPLAGRALARWYDVLCTWLRHLASALHGDTTRTSPTTFGLWLQSTTDDIGIYCGLLDKNDTGLNQQVQPPPPPDVGELSPRPHLHWCALRTGLIDAVARRVGARTGVAWRVLGQWIRHGFPLHYHGPARRTPPTSSTILRQTSHNVDDNIKPRLVSKLATLLAEGGPMFGPYSTPPFTAGVVSPILGVPKKDGSVRPVYHCSYPQDRHGPSATRSLNGGIDRASFWFPSYDSVASLVLQWYFQEWMLEERSRAPRERDFVIFKLDFASAFRQVPVRREDWPLLMLYDACSNSYVLETCAAFGTRISADLWLRVANVWKVCLFERGFTSLIIYVDDLAVICRRAALPALFQVVTTLETQLGTRVHWGKVFVDGGCTARAVVLGVVVDVQAGSLHLDPSKTQQRLQQARRLLSSETWPVSEVEKLVGVFNFFATALPTGRLLLGPLYALVHSGKDVVRVHAHHASRRALEAWVGMLQRALSSSIAQPMYFHGSNVVWLATDASDLGLGGCSSFGAWSTTTAGLESESINVKELLALWASVVEVWGDRLRGKLVHAFVDNESARAWAGQAPSKATRGRSWTRVVSLQYSLALWQQRLGCTLVLHRIPTADNDVADALSRAPMDRLTSEAVADWREQTQRRAAACEGQLAAVEWLGRRVYETPLLWWRTKSTSLGSLVPEHVRSVVNPAGDDPPDHFSRRPLLLTLLQRPVSPAWSHSVIDPHLAEAWWRASAESGQSCT